MTPDEMRVGLRAWSDTLLRGASALHPPVQDAAQAGSVLRPPATEEELRAAEERLGVTLPPSYRTMLSISDGAYADATGIVTASSVVRRRFSTMPGLGFLSATDLRPLRDVKAQIIDLLAVEHEPRPLVADGTPVTDFRPAFGRAILITTEDDASFSALVDAQDGVEWQLWIFSRDEVHGYFSFETWLRSQIEFADVETVMELIARSRRGEPDATRKLGRLRDPRALPILAAALTEFPDNASVVCNGLRALGNMHDDLAIAAIEPWLDSKWSRYACDALVRIGTPQARDALARGGRHHELAALGDARAYELAVTALASGPATPAAVTLRELRRPESVQPLRDAWRRTTHPGARLEIAAALKACGAPEAVELLRALAQDDSFRFRRQARAILERDTQGG